MDLQDKTNIRFSLLFNKECWQLKEDEWAEDIKLIQKVLRERFNVFISATEAIYFWEWRSEKVDAGWMLVHRDDLLQWFPKFIDEGMDWDEE